VAGAIVWGVTGDPHRYEVEPNSRKTIYVGHDGALHF
jgi:hypothetical protein